MQVKINPLDNYLHNPDKELETAYKKAYYQVYEPPFFFSIDAVHPKLDLILEKITPDYQFWVFLTAYNPESIIQKDEVNTKKQAELLNLIRRIGYSYLPGAGIIADLQKK